jgi:hypothetical protein
VKIAQQKMCINALTSPKNCDKIGHTSAADKRLRNIFQKNEKSFEKPLDKPDGKWYTIQAAQKRGKKLIIDN